MVLSGSHGDTVVTGGAYDGILGIVGAIAAVQALRQAGFQPLRWAAGFRAHETRAWSALAVE